MSTSLNYASTPIAGAATLTTGDTSRTAPATFQNLAVPSAASAGQATIASGAQIERWSVVPLASVSTQTTARLFLYDGTNYHLKLEMNIPVTAVSSSNPVPTWQMEAWDNPNLFPIIVPAGWSVRTTVNDTVTGLKSIIEGGAF